MLNKHNFTKSGPLEAAVRLLARRNFSEQELKQRLMAKGFNLPIILETLETVKQKGYLDENRTRQELIEQLVEQKKYGLWMIVTKVKSKGYRTHEPEVREYYPLQTEILVAEKLVEHKGLQDDDPASLQSALRFLRQRGFSAAAISIWTEKWQELSNHAALLDTFSKKNYN